MKVIKRFWRKPTPGQLSIIAKATIDYGGHDAPALRPSETDDLRHGVCIMEAIALATGQEHTDLPICVSENITQVMQRYNDSLPDNKNRNKLKKLVPLIMGTAPLCLVERTKNGEPYLVEEVDNGNLLYQQHEDKRHAMIYRYDIEQDERPSVEDMTIRQFFKFIRDLVEVGKEDRVDTEQTTNPL